VVSVPPQLGLIGFIGSLLFTFTVKIPQFIKGFSPKDLVSNIAGVLGLVGSLALVNIQIGLLPKEYEKYATGLTGMSVVLIGYTTGKSPDLKKGQDDRQS
jgi:NADH:ubiquinone oxidoreductase subunit 4 (subunit M)